MSNGRFLSDIPAALAKFMKLRQTEKNGQVILCGEIDLIQDGVLEDTYLIEVHSVDEYPSQFPKVFEVGGRIPFNIDWHVKKDNSLCIAAPPEEIIACHDGISLELFLEKWVKPYFYNQTFRKRNGYFYKERSHGYLGILESYQEIIGIHNILKIAEILEYVAVHVEPDRTSNCFCGSGEKYRKCHRDIFRTLKKIDSLTLFSHARLFKELLKPKTK